MTRKRYCKLIQSLGHGRNVANMMAEHNRFRRLTYAGEWEVIKYAHEFRIRGGMVTNVVVGRNGIIHVRRKARRAA